MLVDLPIVCLLAIICCATAMDPLIEFESLDCSEKSNNGVKSLDNGNGVYKQCIEYTAKHGCYWDHPLVPKKYTLEEETIDIPSEEYKHLSYKNKCTIVDINGKKYPLYIPTHCIVATRTEGTIKMNVGHINIFAEKIAPYNGNVCHCLTRSPDGADERHKIGYVYCD